MVKKSSKISFLIFTTCMLLAGCTIDYNDQNSNIEKSTAIPDSQMRNFNLVQIKNNKPYTQVTSSLAEIYNRENKTVMFDVKFTEFNSTKNSISTKGSADKVEYYNDSEDAVLKGNLKFYSQKDEIEITGESLFWNSESKIISSDIDSKIYINKDDGSKIEGEGFTANLKNSTFSFKKSVRGVTP
ncbi:LPS export ABC transporter periplasmic protein LptC [Thiospirochaeta perfilievii]|uniref:LPS export ABC transporter periplasmic protein LptC n=1 Tax=Thiospirochaeta perfilievii TaxID=252967 RepID=A0A5C1QBQ4_9SPIO|nr:LPS export ABC transporter periplasmic protein LptC [Thiospirochaeta perfilievii]QEN04818.1 LPS export ABC transporter periplasmic protein LptC [Thiospirochaeta perfilievii]